MFLLRETGAFPKELLTLRNAKGGADNFELKKISERKGTSAIATSEEERLVIIEESELHLVNNETTWVIDSGASFHLTPNRKCFSSYRDGDHGSVWMGNEGACRIVGIGDVWLMTSTGCKLLLKDVLHVSEVWLNLISAG